MFPVYNDIIVVDEMNISDLLVEKFFDCRHFDSTVEVGGRK